MARYPSIDDYSKRGNYQEGVQRCNQLLKKNPNDVQLLVVKFQLLCASRQDGSTVLDQILAIEPPLQDINEIVTIEAAMVGSQRDVFPPPLSAGPVVAKIWEKAFKSPAAESYRVNLLLARFKRAMLDNRTVDAQQALIQLKGAQPKNRLVYMAHAAVTQLLSTSKDDLQSRLALSLARKAVSERFDDDKSLDCRVPGQIFALQSSTKDLEIISGRRFQESKQVYEALRRAETGTINGSIADTIAEPSTIPVRDWFASEVSALKQQFKKLVEYNAPPDTMITFVTNGIRLFHIGCTSLGLAESRACAEACFLSISGLVKVFNDSNDVSYLLYGAYLAHVLLKKSSHTHDALVIQVYLFMRLELGPLAVRAFDSLEVKEILIDTFGHTFFTRISVIHPHETRVSNNTTFNPHDRMLWALTMFDRHEGKLAETEAAVLDHGQSGMIFDIQDLRNHLRLSMTRRLIVLEARRAARLTKKDLVKSAAGIQPKVVANWIHLKDNRGFGAAFDYGFNVEKALYRRDADIPGQFLILCALVTDTTWCLANELSSLVNDTNNLIQDFSQLLDGSVTEDTASEGLIPYGLTAAELFAGEICLRTLRIVTQAQDKLRPTDEAIEEVTQLIEKLKIDQLTAATSILTEHLSDHYIYIDVLKVTLGVCRYVIRKTATPSKKVEDLQELAGRLVEKLQDHAHKQPTSITAKSVSRTMETQPVLWESIHTFGETTTKAFLDDVAAAAREGWDGVWRIQ